MRPLAALIITLALGFFLSTALVRQANLLVPNQHESKRDLTDIDKRLMDERSATSKWLIGIAYATLAALFGLRLKEQTGALNLRSSMPMIACALLVVSLYGGFLYESATISALARGPIDLLYGPFVEVPLSIQLWTLLFALAILAYWYLKPSAAVQQTAAEPKAGFVSATPANTSQPIEKREGDQQKSS